MLRESSTANLVSGPDSDGVMAVVDDCCDSAVPATRELRAFADAIALLDSDELPGARDALVQVAGEAAMRQAAAVCGYFAAMNRLLDATGVPVSSDYDVAGELGRKVPDHLRRTND